MNLKKLRDTIKRLKEGKGINDTVDYGIDIELKGIKQTVEAVDEFMVFVHHGNETTQVDLTNIPLWQEIKELLNT